MKTYLLIVPVFLEPQRRTKLEQKKMSIQFG